MCLLQRQGIQMGALEEARGSPRLLAQPLKQPEKVGIGELVFWGTEGSGWAFKPKVERVTQ